MSDELKPCPFCEGEAQIKLSVQMHMNLKVGCFSCEIFFEHWGHASYWDKDTALKCLTDKWNTRQKEED